MGSSEQSCQYCVSSAYSQRAILDFTPFRLSWQLPVNKRCRSVVVTFVNIPKLPDIIDVNDQGRNGEFRDCADSILGNLQ